MVDDDAVLLVNDIIPDAVKVVTPDTDPLIAKLSPILTVPLIPTPPVTTNVPVVILDDKVPAVNVTDPDDDKEVSVPIDVIFDCDDSSP